MAAPRGPLDDPDRPERAAGRLVQAPRERDDVEAARRAVGPRLDEALEEQLAERLMVAVQLAVGGDHDERRLVVGQGPGRQARLEPVPRRSGRRRPSRAARTRPRPTGRRRTARPRCSRPPPSSTRYGRRVSTCGVAGLPRARGSCARCRPRPGAAGSAGRPRSRAATSRSPAGRSARSKSRRPQRISVRRSAAEASGRIVWWNGWASPLMPRSPVDERRDRRPDRRRSSQPASVGPRSHEMCREVAALGVRPVALGADPRVPVVGRRGRRVGRDARR